MEKQLTRLARWNIYFRRGYGTWIGFAISLLATYPAAAAVYNWFVVNFALVLPLIPNLTVFVIYATLGVLVVSVLIGFLDYKRGTFPVESRIVGLYAPYITDQFLAMQLFFDGKVEEAKKICRRWTQR